MQADRVRTIKDNIRRSYSLNEGFPVYSAEELRKMYAAFGVDPRSTDRRIFDTESMSHHNQKEVIKLLDSLAPAPEDTLLDVGCGNGAPGRLAAKLYRCKVVGIDLTQEQIDKAADCSVFEGVRDLITLRVSDVHELEYEPGSFRKMFHNESMCHWHDKREALARLFRILERGGLMAFHDWLSGDVGDLNSAGGGFRGTYAENVWFQNSLESTVELLKNAGFVVVNASETTDVVDRGLRARLKELELSTVYESAASREYLEKSLRYFRAMIDTHYKYLRYGRFLCRKAMG